MRLPTTTWRNTMPRTDHTHPNHLDEKMGSRHLAKLAADRLNKIRKLGHALTMISRGKPLGLRRDQMIFIARAALREAGEETS